MSRYIDAEPYEDCRIVLHKEDSGVKVKDIPTADVEEVRHGEWCGTVCSACGASVSNGFDYDYCPMCGAKMDGGTK